MKETLHDIATALIEWSKENPRSLPWKSSRDPYRIWVSEIILQQTRVAQGLPYYHRFIRTFPNIESLAEASIDELYKVWEGLGYYRRARHMHEAAKTIMEDHRGKFPDNHADILSLKGIGSYSAAAIASFAFDLPHAVIDGNVNRVISRLFAIQEPVDSLKGKKAIKSKVQMIFPERSAASFNQAIMDFGATLCVPKAPSCYQCPLQDNCRSQKMGIVADLPRKKPRRARRNRHFHYLVIRDGDYTWIKKRGSNDVWQNLYEFYPVETAEATSWTDIIEKIPGELELVYLSDIYQQILTHQKIYATFAEVKWISKIDVLEKLGYRRVHCKKLRNFAFPKIIDCYLKEKSVNLNLAF